MLVVDPVQSLIASSDIITVGGNVTIVLQAMWSEAGLVPSPASCCLINGVNVSSSFSGFAEPKAPHSIGLA